MKIKYHDANKLPVAVIDGIYNEEEINYIMDEIRFLSKRDKLKDANHTGGASRDIREEESFDAPEGSRVSLKKNLGMFLDNTYFDRDASDILFFNRKIFVDEELNETLINYNPYFKLLSSSDHDSTLISYYEDGDYYHNHTDRSVLTCITWFFEQPKKFTGGNLVIEDSLEIECKFNRSVIFPGIAQHKVTKIDMDETDKNKWLGRYTMSQFLNMRL